MSAEHPGDGVAPGAPSGDFGKDRRGNTGAPRSAFYCFEDSLGSACGRPSLRRGTPSLLLGLRPSAEEGVCLGHHLFTGRSEFDGEFVNDHCTCRRLSDAT